MSIYCFHSRKVASVHTQSILVMRLHNLKNCILYYQINCSSELGSGDRLSFIIAIYNANVLQDLEQLVDENSPSSDSSYSFINTFRSNYSTININEFRSRLECKFIVSTKNRFQFKLESLEVGWERERGSSFSI